MVANQNTKALSIIETVQNDPLVIQAQKNLNDVLAIKQAVFQQGVHYGPPYKGAKNDTLLKPGATFLQQKFQLREHHERLETTIHVDADDPSKSYIIIQNRCRIFNADGQEVAQADAACTTFEDKYMYRGGGDRTCPKCGQSNIMRSGFAPKNNPNGEKGWYCNAKKGGCGANFDYNTAEILDQQVTKTRNENPLNLLDTIVAMAQKRASVRATIKATGVDALFSPGDGVTVDYYDDLEQTEQELINVVQKNAPDGTQSNKTGTSSDLSVLDHPDYQPAQKTPAQRLGTPSGQRIGSEAPVEGECRDFQVTNVKVVFKDGQPRYALNATNNTTIWAYSRDVFRSMGYPESVIEDWGAKEQTIKFEQKMPVQAEWKLYQNDKGGGYWSAQYEKVERLPGQDEPF